MERLGLYFNPIIILPTLGDCPDAAYFGPNVHADRDEVEMLKLKDDSGEAGP